MVRPAADAPNSTNAPAGAFMERRRKKRLLLALVPPLVATFGLVRFSVSFFLARRSLAARSACGGGEHGASAHDILTRVLGLSSEEVSGLVQDGYVVGDNDSSNGDENRGEGCWVPRTVDAAIIVVVDALRFDFAVGRLPKSIGSRLRQNGVPNSNNNEKDAPAQSKSRLFTFVADPPTVTMQRLKGLTTGGLPTFADISGNFGGASIDEDSWIQQLHDVPIAKRRRQGRRGRSGEQTQRVGARMAFVGDDTWVDLFPTQFDDSNPYPSFNTRDLDTVDEGCMEHLPRLLSNLGGGGSNTRNDEEDKVKEGEFELVVAHFLGVDHVGHTYGPHDRHMTEKLAQMDDVLSYVLETIDSTPTDYCRAALVFGDHGMTEDGNHGGGTDDETNAALFVHYSKGCGGMGAIASGASAGAGVADPAAAVEAFESIHQIDLVPTISAMLGLPIPYANLGGLVPALLPAPRRSRHHNQRENDESDLTRVQAAAAALALNAAQIWNYLETYSRTANKLPSADMAELKELLDKATEAYRMALLSSSSQVQGGQGSLVAYRKACSLCKLFLSEATELGKRVWTRFDTNGMILGGFLLGIALLLSFPAWNSFVPALGDCREWAVHYVAGFTATSRGPNNASPRSALDVGRLVESGAALLFMIFHCLVLTFSNSYIISENQIIMFLLASLCISMTIRQWININDRPGDHAGAEELKDHGKTVDTSLQRHAMWIPILVALCSRANELFVTGHGLDPSIRSHAAHDASAFLFSLAMLVVFRLCISHSASIHRPNYRSGRQGSVAAYHIAKHSGALVDVVCLVLFAFSWWEKRSPDHSRNGYKTCRAALLISLLGAVFSIFWPAYVGSVVVWDSRRHIKDGGQRMEKSFQMLSFLPNYVHFHSILSVLFKILTFTVGTMGPSAAASSVMFLTQAWALYKITAVTGLQRSAAPLVASLWRLSIRHAFFATNHAPTFSSLQYSAAFVASDTFYFHTAGLSLFLNTFGWEIMGAILVMAVTSQTVRRQDVWHWFCFYQLLEAADSCISVSLMRRHLMVWAIFAPRFVFACVFTLICLVFWLLGVITNVATVQSEAKVRPSAGRKNFMSQLMSIFISLSCVISTSAYSTLTIVDAENVRGKSNFKLRHDDLIDALGLWTAVPQNEDDASQIYHSSSLVIDHGSRPSSFYQPLPGGINRSNEGIAVLFSGPNAKADDVIARDVGKIASEASNNGDLKLIRVVTSDQGLRSRCRFAFDEALSNISSKKKSRWRRKESPRTRRRGKSPLSDDLTLEFIPSITFLSQLRERSRCGFSNPQETINDKKFSGTICDDLVEALHKDIELRGKLYQVETSLRESKKSSNSEQKQRLIEKGCKICQKIYNSRDEDGNTILDRVLMVNGGKETTLSSSGWHEIRCEAGRAELTGDRMLQAEYLRRQLEKRFPSENKLCHSPSAFHYLCHQRFHKGRQPNDEPFTISAFDTAVEKLRLVIVSGTAPSNDEPLPRGDVLLHLGDFTTRIDNNVNTPKRKLNDQSVSNLDEWLTSQPHPIKLVLRGANDPPEAKVDLSKSNAMYVDRPRTISFGGGNIIITLVPHCAERDLSSSWRRLPLTFDVLVTRQMFHSATMIANRVELMFSGPPHLWLTGDISRGVYDECEHIVAKCSATMRQTSIIYGKEWSTEDDSSNFEPFVIDIAKEMESDEIEFDIVN